MQKKAVLEERVFAPPSASPAAADTDEIKLVELLVLVTSRKKLFWGVALGFFVLTMLAWFLLPASYLYMTTVELGTAVAGEEVQLLEPAAAALAKLEHSWIPTYQERLAQVEDDPLEFRAYIPKRTSLLVLETRGPAEDETEHREAHDAVLSPMFTEHKRLEDIVKLRLNTELQREQLQLDNIKDGLVVRQTRYKNVEEEKRLLEEEVRQLRSDITESRRQWQEAVTDVEEEARAVILMLLDTEIRKSRTQLEKAEKDLYIELPNSRAELAKELEDGKREQEQQAAVIAGVEQQLGALRGSRAVGRAVRSSEEVGFGGLSAVIAVFVASVAGLVAALAGVFLARLLEELRLQKGSSAA